MNKELTWQNAIQEVLTQHPSGLHYTDITERILNQGLKKQLGATPAATVSALITSTIKKSASSSPYVRVNRGVFALKKFLSGEVVKQLEAVSSKELQNDDEKSQIIQGFGMYWQRSAVNWKSNPKILAATENEAFDVSEQAGIYLLHDGSKTVYAGQTDNLGRRLFEHTKGRMAFRWDRFSWFGIRPISEAGTLGEPPVSYSPNGLMNALEAVLIEAMEPSLNRRQGDGLKGIEYAQCANKITQ
jgi:hypothetical protein